MVMEKSGSIDYLSSHDEVITGKWLQHYTMRGNPQVTIGVLSQMAINAEIWWFIFY